MARLPERVVCTHHNGRTRQAMYVRTSWGEWRLSHTRASGAWRKVPEAPETVSAGDRRVGPFHVWLSDEAMQERLRTAYVHLPAETV